VSILTRANIPFLGYWGYILVLTLTVFACGSTPTHKDVVPKVSRGASISNQLISVANSLLGTPYRYGGANPGGGLDCSGLVHYAHLRVGLTIPRNTRRQLENARPVELSRIRPGDLLFFRLSRRKVSHVGIYTGDNRFIHASSSGKGVSYANLENVYWKKHLIAAGRYF
jgi:cell wall-associated NlpC family hydrolase